MKKIIVRQKYNATFKVGNETYNLHTHLLPKKFIDMFKSILSSSTINGKQVVMIKTQPIFEERFVVKQPARDAVDSDCVGSLEDCIKECLSLQDDILIYEQRLVDGEWKTLHVHHLKFQLDDNGFPVIQKTSTDQN